MKRLFKTLAVGVTSAAMVASMGTAFAQTEMSNMVFAGYDTTNPLEPNRVYNEVINGRYTNKQVLVPVEAEWVEEFYEAVYPYAGYSRMYLDGNAQDITVYNHLSPQWETRRRDYMWEMAAPYKIYERHQTKFNNQTWQWDYGNDFFNIPDSALMTPTIREATVLDVEWKDYGFGAYTNDGTLLTDEQIDMYSYFNVEDVASAEVLGKAANGTIVDVWDAIVDTYLNPAVLSARDPETNRYVFTDEDVAAVVPVVMNKYITAKFNPVGTEGLATKSAADEFLLRGTDWRWDADSLIVAYTADIDWTAPTYEMAEPYYQYQHLIINGVVMDGRTARERSSVTQAARLLPLLPGSSICSRELLTRTAMKSPTFTK